MIKKKEEHASHERWLVSYADLVTLLFALFVVLYAMSKIDQQKFKSLSKSLKGSLGNSANEKPTEKSNSPSEESSAQNEQGAVRTTEAAVRHYAALAQKLDQSFESKFEGQDMSHAYRISFNDRSTLIRLNATAFFNSAEASVRKESYSILDAIAQILKEVPEKVKIEGHTDSTPIQSPLFGSNWELAAGRAAWIARYFIGRHQIGPTRIEIASFGEYKPLESNQTESGKASNRRIDIFLQEPDPVSKK